MSNEFLIRIRADDQASAAIGKVNKAINKVGDPLSKTESRLSSFGACSSSKSWTGLRAHSRD